jgi:hypothetical protein
VFVEKSHVPGGESGTRQSFIRVHSPLQAEIDHLETPIRTIATVNVSLQEDFVDSWHHTNKV